MARALSTVKGTSANSTAGTNQKFTLLSTNGYYFKSSGFDATKLVILIARSTASSDVGRVTVISGSTAGKTDFEPGAYSTARNLDISIATSTAGSTKIHAIHIEDTQRFKDTDDYIKVDFSTAMGGGAARIAPIFIAS